MKYKVLKNFWYNNVQMEKGTIVENLPKRLTDCGLICEYVSDAVPSMGEKGAKSVVELDDIAQNLSKEDVIACTDACNDNESTLSHEDTQSTSTDRVEEVKTENAKTQKKKFKKRKNVLLEKKEPSEIEIDSTL